MAEEALQDKEEWVEMSSTIMKKILCVVIAAGLFLAIGIQLLEREADWADWVETAKDVDASWSRVDGSDGFSVCEGVFYGDGVSETVTANGGLGFIISSEPAETATGDPKKWWRGTIHLEKWDDEKQGYIVKLSSECLWSGGFPAKGKWRLRAVGMNGKPCPYRIVGRTGSLDPVPEKDWL